MRSLDDPPRSAADLNRLRQLSALFDYAELITEYPAGPERDEVARHLIRESAHLSALNMMSRQERDSIIDILSSVMPADVLP